jgi:thiosulfate reductase / polysulfide reductase chain A
MFFSVPYFSPSGKSPLSLAVDPHVALHPDTAATLGLSEDDWAWVVTPQGRIRLRVHLTPALDPRMVGAQHRWWFPERSAAAPELFGLFESNANMHCPDEAKFCSPEIGGWPHTALLCRVEAEESGASM